MRRAVRLVLTWLLAFALPLQGVATASRAAYATQSADAMTVTTPANSPGADSAAQHWHRHGASPDADDPVGQAAHGANLPGDAGHKCSACASCCLNAVVPTDAICFDAIALPDLFAPLVRATPAAYLTEGLERPPRSLLA